MHEYTALVVFLEASGEFPEELSPDERFEAELELLNQLLPRRSPAEAASVLRSDAFRMEYNKRRGPSVKHNK